jgi:hypothetical protein
VDRTSVYWTDTGLITSATVSGTVMKIPLAGGTPTTLASGQDQPYGIAVDTSAVYWTNRRDGRVMKVPVGGGAPATVASGQRAPYGIAVNGTSAYWTDPSHRR